MIILFSRNVGEGGLTIEHACTCDLKIKSRHTFCHHDYYHSPSQGLPLLRIPQTIIMIIVQRYFNFRMFKCALGTLWGFQIHTKQSTNAVLKICFAVVNYHFHFYCYYCYYYQCYYYYYLLFYYYHYYNNCVILIINIIIDIIIITLLLLSLL